MSARRSSLLERIPRALRVLSGQPASGRRVTRANFRGAEVSRILSDWFARCMAPDDEIRGDMMLMRARARDLARNDPLVKQFLNLLAANVIGPRGPRMQARVRDSQGNLLRNVNTMIEEAWTRWATGPVTADGKLTLTEFAHLQLRTAATDGEGLTRFRNGMKFRHGLALQGIDPDLLDETFHHVIVPGEREVRLGVEIDGDLAPLGYWIWDRGTYEPASITRQRYRLPADQVLHQFSTDRVHQMRGITWLAPIMLLIQHLERYTEAELVAARVGAAAVAFIIQKDASLADVDDEEGAESTGQAQPEIEMNPGSTYRLAPGEDVSGFTPNHPTTAFPDFTKSIMRRISTGLAMAYNTLANDLEGVNFSSMRHGLQIEQDSWEMLQEWQLANFYEPIRQAWLSSAILSGELQLPGSDWRQFAAARWIQRGRPYVNPLQDRQAQQLALQNGLTSRQRITMRQGEDFEEILEELAAEAEMAREYGLQIDGANVITVAAQPADGSGDETPVDGSMPADGADAAGGAVSTRARSRIGQFFAHRNGKAR